MTTPDAAFRAFHQQLSRYIQRRLGRADDTGDILQEVFVRVLRHEDALRKARTPLAWLYTITNTVIVDHLRKSGRQVTVAEIPEITAQGSPDPGFGTCIMPLLNALPVKYRDALQFTDMLGGRQTEFAVESGQNLSTVKSQVQRGRRMLKEAILGCCAIDFDKDNKVLDVYPNVDCNDDCC